MSVRQDVCLPIKRILNLVNRRTYQRNKIDLSRWLNKQKKKNKKQKKKTEQNNKNKMWQKDIEMIRAHRDDI